MLGELVKILADEPEKIETALIKAIRIVFSLIISSFLYTRFIGTYTLIPLNDYESLIEFFLSGRILICLLLFFVSEYVIIPVIEVVARSPLWLNRKYNIIKFTDVETTPFLTFFDVIKIDKKNRIPIPGKNIDLLKSFAEEMDDDNTKEEVVDLKNSIITNMWVLYLIFVLIFIFVIDKSNYPQLLKSIVLSVLPLLFVMAIGIQCMFDYLFENHKAISESLTFIKINSVIEESFKNHKIELQEGEKNSGLSKTKVFYRNGKEYVLIRKIYSQKIYVERIQRFITKHLKPNRIFILIVFQDLLDDSSALSLETFRNLITIEYSDEENLKAQLNNTLTSI